MNFLFGLIPALPIVIFALVIWWLKWISAKELGALVIFTLGVTAFFSGQTYGPRIEVTGMQMPSDPEPVDVRSGKKMIEEVNRIGQFDERIEAAP